MPRHIRYFHLLLDAHHVIVANNAATESLFLGEEASGAKEVCDAGCLPVNPTCAFSADHALAKKPARPIVSGKRARALCNCMIKNRQSGVERPLDHGPVGKVA